MRCSINGAVHRPVAAMPPPGGGLDVKLKSSAIVCAENEHQAVQLRVVQESTAPSGESSCKGASLGQLETIELSLWARCASWMPERQALLTRFPRKETRTGDIVMRRLAAASSWPLMSI